VPRVLAIVVLLFGCTADDAAPADGAIGPSLDGGVPDGAPIDAIPLAPTLTSIKARILQKRCGCHVGGSMPAGNLDFAGDPYAALVGVSAAGLECAPTGLQIVVPGEPSVSLLYLKVAAKAGLEPSPCGLEMPKGTFNPALSPEELDAIEQWIADGALEN